MAPDLRIIHGIEVDGDAVPRRFAWEDDRYRRMRDSHKEWRKWYRDTWKRIGTWARRRSARGDDGWVRYRDMLRILRATPIRIMEEAPHLHYHFKALEREIDGGTHSMRYNHRMRLLFTFETDVDGVAVVKIIKLSDHYA